jgi:hypothetical protein
MWMEVSNQMTVVLDQMLEVSKLQQEPVACGSWKVVYGDYSVGAKPRCHGIYASGEITLKVPSDVTQLISKTGVVPRSNLNMDVHVKAPYVEMYTRPKESKLFIDAQVSRLFTYWPADMELNGSCNIQCYGIRSVPKEFKPRVSFMDAIRFVPLAGVRPCRKGCSQWHSWALGVLPTEWAEGAIERREDFNECLRALVTCPPKFVELHEQRSWSLRMQYRTVPELIDCATQGEDQERRRWWWNKVLQVL